jgi:methyl-accepting chemotaxis protein
MRQSLLVANEREQQEKFKTLGLAEVSEILRATHDLHELAEKVIVKLVKYMKANQGGLFILHEENGDEGHLELAACYAYDRKKFLQKSVQVGEGLVGQAVLERDVIYLTEVPANYISIKSGLGGANPRSILIVPLVVNDKIEGVIELASFNLFQPFEIEFMQKLGESIASTIASVKINERTKHLLEESQIQSEQMRAQEEEMRQNMEEIAATQEEMQRKNSEMERLVNETQEQSRQLAINEKRVTAVLNSVSAAIIQTDANGTIQTINEVGESMFGYGKGDLNDTSIDALLPGARTADRKEGERNNETAHRQNGTTFTSSVSFKKLVTEEGTSFLYFISDIDEDVKREREMQRRQEEIASLLEQARENEEMMRAQEEIMKQNLEEMNTIQESLKEKAEENERVRLEEKMRSEALIESQKKVMEKILQRHREKEEQLNAQLTALQAELDKHKG